jgi:hypothetical protein
MVLSWRGISVVVYTRKDGGGGTMVMAGIASAGSPLPRDRLRSLRSLRNRSVAEVAEVAAVGRASWGGKSRVALGEYTSPKLIVGMKGPAE